MHAFQNSIFGIADNLICNLIDYETPLCLGKAYHALNLFIHSLLTGINSVSHMHTYIIWPQCAETAFTFCRSDLYVILSLCFISVDTHIYDWPCSTSHGVTCLLKIVLQLLLGLMFTQTNVHRQSSFSISIF